MGKTLLKIKSINSLGRPISNHSIKLMLIDDDYYSPKRNDFSTKTNKKGEAEVGIPKGTYLIKATTNKTFIEKIQKIKKNTNIIIKVPLNLGIFSRTKKISENKIRNIYEKNRTDNDKCFKCKAKYKSFGDRFLCRYCQKHFCSKHRLPENHDCWGEPKAPSGGFREIHEHSGKIKAGGE